MCALRASVPLVHWCLRELRCEVMANMIRKLELLEMRAALTHTPWCDFGRRTGDAGDYCTCALRERRAVVQEEIDAL